MYRINYDSKTKKVSQFLDDVTTYSLNGSFSEAIDTLKEVYKEYEEKYIKLGREIKLPGCYGKEYIDKTKSKFVKFDKLLIEFGRDVYDEADVLSIYGERDYLPEELEYEKNIDKIKRTSIEEKEKEQLKILLEKYGKV